jgi:hypothetical protein
MVCTESGCAMGLEVSHRHRDKSVGGNRRTEEKRTCMSRQSNRQSLEVMMSGWFGTRTVKQDLPPNMREMGDSTELAYSCPCICQQCRARVQRSAHIVVSLSYFSLSHG